MKPTPLLAVLLASVAFAAPEPKFRMQEIDKISIGYGLAIADVDGDGKPDIILADQHTVQWYHNPDWKKHVIAENLTKEDNVCVAAQDIDGSGKCAIAIGAGCSATTIHENQFITVINQIAGTPAQGRRGKFLW